MLRIEFEQFGGPEVLKLVDVPAPEPGPGQVRVRQAAIGLNYIDTYHRSGLNPVRLPSSLGSEGAGVIDAMGEGVEGWRLGERVAYAAGSPLGAYAECYVLPAAKLVRLPPEVDERTAAAVMLKGMTAEMLLYRVFPVQSGQTILVHAAAGGMGSILCAWAASLGVRVLGTVGSEAKVPLAKENGCAEVILYDREDVAARVRDLTGGAGVPVVYDGVGASTFHASIKSLSRRGMLVNFGNASGPAPPIAPIDLGRAGSLFLTRPGLFDYTATRAELELSADRVFDALAAGRFSPRVGQTFPLSQAREAHMALHARTTSGATLLIP